MNRRKNTLRTAAAQAAATALLAIALSVPGPDSGSALADTVREYHGGATGYTEVTTDSAGNRIREVTHQEDGTITGNLERDPETGETKTTTYVDGTPTTRETRNADNEVVQRDTLDANGTATQTETFDEVGGSEGTLEFTRDDQGRLTEVTSRGGGNAIDEYTSYDYDEDGHMIMESRHLFNEDGTRTVQTRHYDKDGKITEEMSVTHDRDNNLVGSFRRVNGVIVSQFGTTNVDFSGITEHLNNADGRNTTTYRHSNGTIFIVRRNPDGSVDITVLDRNGNLLSLQYYDFTPPFLNSLQEFYRPPPAPPVRAAEPLSLGDDALQGQHLDALAAAIYGLAGQQQMAVALPYDVDYTPSALEAAYAAIHDRRSDLIKAAALDRQRDRDRNHGGHGSQGGHGGQGGGAAGESGHPTAEPAAALGAFADALGNYAGDDGCGFSSLQLVDNGGLVLQQPGGSVPLSVAGSQASGQNVTLFGIGNHRLTIRLQGGALALQGDHPGGASCNSFFERLG